LLFAAVFCVWLAFGMARIPLSSRNIYEQQFQMHRFAVEFHKKPVAVNDLGWVAYRNDQYVLDLRGLASIEALRRRSHPEEGSGWMDSIARVRDVELAMIYDRWLKHRIPSSWVRLGALRLGHPRVSVADAEVAFYATREDAVAGLSSELRAFESSLPPKVRFVFDGEVRAP
jgi:hypothetical protein